MTQRDAPLTMRDLWRQFLPLSLSDLIMAVAGPIIILGLARLPDQTVHLAAFGVAEAMAILIEAPIIMILHASTALSRDRTAYRALWWFMVWANVGLTLLFGLIAFTPLYDLVFRTWLGQPEAVADAALPAFQVMLLWPAAIGWRRFYQGQLIAQRQTGKVGLASIYRLISVAVTVLIGVLLRLPGAMVGGLALAVSVIVEAAAVTWYAWRERSRFTWSDAPEHLPRTLGSVALWYFPLGLTSVLVWTSRPAISGGIARAELPELSLAAWPAAWMLMMLVANAVRMNQQLVIREATSAANYRVLKRFTLRAGLAASAVLALIAFSPANGEVLRSMTGLTGEVARVAVPALRIGFLFPLGIAILTHLQGLLIRNGRTGTVNLGATTGTIVLLITMAIGVTAGWLGTVVGAVAVMVGQAAEITFLYVMTQRERAALS